MGDALEAFFKFVEQFTWRKALLAFAMLALVLFATWGYERFTSSFRIGRLQKLAVLIKSAEELDKTNSVELAEAKQELFKQTLAAVKETPVSIQFIPSDLKVSWNVAMRFFWSGAVFWLGALLGGIFAAHGNRGATFAALASLAVFCGVIGIFIPPLLWPWLHVIGVPFVAMVFVIVLGLFFASIATKQQAEKKAKQQNAAQG